MTTDRYDNRVHPEISLPVAVHRWFRNGAAWAWHPHFPDPQDGLIDATTPLLLSREEELKKTMPYKSGTLVCLKCPDPHCEDTKAANRRPSILLCCFLPEDVRSRFENDGQVFSRILRRLQDGSMPRQPGPDPTITLPLVPPPAGPRQRRWSASESAASHPSAAEEPGDLAEQVQLLRNELDTVRKQGFRARPRGPLEFLCMLVWRCLIGLIRAVDLVLMLPFRFLLPSEGAAPESAHAHSATIWPPPPSDDFDTPPEFRQPSADTSTTAQDQPPGPSRH